MKKTGARQVFSMQKSTQNIPEVSQKKRTEHTHENHKKTTSNQEWAEKTIDRHGL